MRLLGGGDVPLSQTADELTFEVPAKRPNDYVAVFEVQGAILTR